MLRKRYGACRIAKLSDEAVETILDPGGMFGRLVIVFQDETLRLEETKILFGNSTEKGFDVLQQRRET